MLKYVFERLLIMVFVVFLVMTLVFFVMHILPGDVVYVILGSDAAPEAYEQMRKELSLDQPIHIQYLIFLEQFLTGDLGRSMQKGIPVTQLIRRAIPYTIDLTLASLFVGLMAGLPLGIHAALQRNTLFDHLGRFITLVFISMPSFFLGILLLYVFGFKLKLFPLIGGGDLGNIQQRLYHLVLPSLTLGLILASAVMRITRSCMLEVINSDYIRTARAKGLSRTVIIYKHALKNALIPVITVIGNYVGPLLGGTVLTETVFTRPGLGKLLVDSIMSRDYPVVQGSVILFAFGVVLTNLIVDLLYNFLNPRMRKTG